MIGLWCIGVNNIRTTHRGLRKKLVFVPVADHHDCVGARRTSRLSETWLSERKDILQKIKGQVRLYLGGETEDVSRYASAYQKDLSRPWEVSRWADLFVCLGQVDVVFGGDFHPFAQSQRAHLRILRKVISERPVVLCLEALMIEDQDFVDQFMAGTLGEEAFLKKVQWDQKWGFPWAHYRPLFEFAIKNKVKLMALNIDISERTALTLQQRDKEAARALYESLNQNLEVLHYVIYGDLHVAQEHLPRELKKLSKKGRPLDIATIYLNAENIYFDLAAQGEESAVEVVAFNDRQFCIIGSPPWVKWQSYLMYLEETFDVDLDVDDDEDEEWDFVVDHTDHVSNLVKMICAGLGENVKTDAIEVYSMRDPQALVATEKNMGAEQYRMAHFLIQNDKSFYIPKEGFFYLSKSTVNHAASLAGQYVHSKLSDRESLLWTFPRDFKRCIWIEAMSFMLSKFVNPKRKAQTIENLKKQLEAFDKSDFRRDPVLLALDELMLELLDVYSQAGETEVFKPREKSSYVLAARFIGEILGERYFLLYHRQILDIDKIGVLLRESVDRKDFDDFYLQQLRWLDRMELEGS